MIPKLTDDAIGRLPLEGGRAALLEEIVRDAPVAEPTRTSRRWVAPLAAAAVVAGIAGGSLWWQERPQDRDPATQAAAQPGASEDDGIVLDAAGWEVDSLGGDGLVFRKGDAFLEITSYDADQYASYVTDREHIYDPPAPGEPIAVLGRPAQMWTYSREDHTAIREVEDGHWLEFRAQGVDEAGYLDLLGRLRTTSQGEFESALPQDYVTDGERLPAALQIIGEIREASGADLPRGSTLSLGSGDAKDAYQFGAEVAGAYACAWLEAFEDATTHGQAEQAAEAARVLGTARQWPVLQRMDEEGDYSEVVWDYADQVAAGQVPEGYREGLGC